jgi:hypothetical protein
MQQRRLRLGDILDDYCPRERRITNHAVVAMIEDEVRQTRCTTCDAEHEFKGAKMPTLRKKKDSASAAYKEVLANVVKEGNGVPVAPAMAAPAPAAPEAVASPSPVAPETASPPRSLAAVAPADQPTPSQPEPVAVAEPSSAPDEAEPEDAEGGEGGEGRVHRRLIRAQLPRPENHQVVRPVPEFTMRQPTGRGGKFRAAGARAQRQVVGRGGNANAGGGRGGFTRTMPGRSVQGGRATGRPDAHRARGGQPPRHGKKHSK